MVANELARERALNRAPQSVLDLLEKAGQPEGRSRFGPRGSTNSWVETLVADYADGTQILNSTTEAAMIPDVRNITLPKNYLVVGRTLRLTLYFDMSFVITTPGTLTFRLRQNTTGGTAMATSGAYAPDPTAAVTTRSGWIEYLVTCRAVGTAGTTFTMGRMGLGDLDDASATTLQGNLNMFVIPASAPAVVTQDTTATLQLTPTATFSVATATTQLTNHLAIFESLN